jgi:hypothetical protein
MIQGVIDMRMKTPHGPDIVTKGITTAIIQSYTELTIEVIAGTIPIAVIVIMMEIDIEMVVVTVMIVEIGIMMTIEENVDISIPKGIHTVNVEGKKTRAEKEVENKKDIVMIETVEEPKRLLRATPLIIAVARLDFLLLQPAMLRQQRYPNLSL